MLSHSQVPSTVLVMYINKLVRLGVPLIFHGNLKWIRIYNENETILKSIYHLMVLRKSPRAQYSQWKYMPGGVTLSGLYFWKSKETPFSEVLPHN